MAPQPKSKNSKGSRGRRRAHDALKARQLVRCDNCRELKLPHTVCPHCGTYRGREVITIEE
jgi:large subunit ribosomal protein L32